MTKHFINITRELAVNWDGEVHIPYCREYVEGEALFSSYLPTVSILYFLFTKYRPQYKVAGLRGVYTPKLFCRYTDETEQVRAYSMLYDVRVEWDDRYTRYNVLSSRWDDKYNKQGRVVAQQSTAL